MAKSKKTKVLFVASEVFPFSKTGGLADVSISLPLALKKEKIDIRVVTPFYKNLKEKEKLKFVLDYPVKLGEKSETAVLYETSVKRLLCYFIKNYQYFERDEYYGYSDDNYRFLFFSEAVIQLLKHLRWKPDIIHTNDWQSALIALFLKRKYPEYSSIKVIFTIHNLRYQGIFDYEKNLINLIGLGDDIFSHEELEFWGKLNYMKAGIIYSDVVTTVSPTYSRQILTPDYGEGLEGLLQRYSHKLKGILNGLDYQYWNPEKDKEIYKNYSVEKFDGKYINKEKLQAELGLPLREDIPVFSVISRITEQKGFDILYKALTKLLKEKDFQFVLLGTGDLFYEKAFSQLREKYRDKVSVNIKFDAIASKRIYAGSDFIVVPSLFEPCGLIQMIGFRYGTIPLVRKTGGLADTVKDISESGGNGFVFEKYSSEELFFAFNRAIEFAKSKTALQTLQKQLMQLDFSWQKLCYPYKELYQKLKGEI
jgi:starch synthase